MNRINLVMNSVVVALLVGVAGYLTYSSSGFGIIPSFGEPDDTWFRAQVLESTRPVVVKFGASWCPPCRMMEPVLDQLESSGRVAVVRIDVDKYRELARNYHVGSIPDVFLFNHGKVVAHRVGFVDYHELTKWISQHESQ